MKEIDLAGKAEVNLNGLFTAEKLDISVAGSGKINPERLGFSRPTFYKHSREFLHQRKSTECRNLA